jgi:uncharacterized protein (TIGR02246 family)
MSFQMSDQHEIRSLYQELLSCWNRRSGHDFAALFDIQGMVVGFDGSDYETPAQIESELSKIFAHHPTAAFVGIVRAVRFLSPDLAVLRATAGMVPPGQSDINPAVNVVQMLVTVRCDAAWRIAVFQNTPAAYHGRPELVEKLSAELRQQLRAENKA